MDNVFVKSSRLNNGIFERAHLFTKKSVFIIALSLCFLFSGFLILQMISKTNDKTAGKIVASQDVLQEEKQKLVENYTNKIADLSNSLEKLFSTNNYNDENFLNKLNSIMSDVSDVFVNIENTLDKSNLTRGAVLRLSYWDLWDLITGVGHGLSEGIKAAGGLGAVIALLQSAWTTISALLGAWFPVVMVLLMALGVILISYVATALIDGRGLEFGFRWVVIPYIDFI